jgi:hypothetical protein
VQAFCPRAGPSSKEATRRAESHEVRVHWEVIENVRVLPAVPCKVGGLVGGICYFGWQALAGDNWERPIRHKASARSKAIGK